MHIVGIKVFLSLVAVLFVDVDEGVRVGGSCLSCSLVSKPQGFEFYAGSNWEPVEVYEQQGLDHLQGF